MVFHTFHIEYVKRQRHNGIKYVLMPVTLTPKAAKFDEIAFEPTVKHWPPAHSVVVVWVSALKIVVRPVTPSRPLDASPFSSAIYFLIL